MQNLTIWRAELESLDQAFSIVSEYYDAVGVMVRESRDQFAAYYFGEGSGVWLASTGQAVIGCIALRPLALQPGRSGEVKRLYVRPAWRGRGVADLLLDELHAYAASAGYQWMYLDSKDDLEAAKRFYKRRGYEACQRYNDNPQATVFMRKDLTRPGINEDARAGSSK